MPYKDKEIQKHYYSIGEVAKMFDVSTSLIRFWEGQFSILKPKKNRKGNRLFTTKDIDNLHAIYHLLRERGYTIEGAKKKLKENKTDVFKQVEIVRSLKKIKQFLLSIKESLD